MKYIFLFLSVFLFVVLIGCAENPTAANVCFFRKSRSKIFPFYSFNFKKQCREVAPDSGSAVFVDVPNAARRQMAASLYMKPPFLLGLFQEVSDYQILDLCNLPVAFIAS